MTDRLFVVHAHAKPSAFAGSLRQAGYDVVSLNGIAACREAVTQRTPDLILYDALADGAALLTEFAALYALPTLKLVPLVLLTPSVEILHDQAEHLTLVDDIIVFPISAEGLCARLDWRLARSRQWRAELTGGIDALRQQTLDYLGQELMSPLFTILAGSKSLRDAPVKPGDPLQAELAGTIHQAADTLYRYLQNYLLYLQLSSPDQEAVFSPLPGVAPVAADREIAAAARRAAQRYGREEDLALDLTPTQVAIPQVDVSKIVEELVEQACRLSEPGSTIHVACTRNPVFAILVSDSRPARSRTSPAHDLGMTLVRLLAQSHGGQLTLQPAIGLSGLLATVSFANVSSSSRHDGTS